MTILDRSSGAFNSAAAFSVTRSSGNYGTGTTIVVAVVSNTVVNTPGSTTQRASSVVSMGIYAFDKTAAGDASIAFTCSTGSGVWFAWELSAGSTFLTPADITQSGSVATTYTVGPLTPSAGDRHLLTAVGGAPGGGSIRTVSAFSDSFTKWADQQAASSDYPFAGGADRSVTANGSTAYSTTATFSGGNIGGGVLLAYIDNAGDVTAPTVPAGLGTTTLGSTTATLGWSGSTDAVGVTGYEVRVVGP